MNVANHECLPVHMMAVAIRQNRKCISKNIYVTFTDNCNFTSVTSLCRKTFQNKLVMCCQWNCVFILLVLIRFHLAFILSRSIGIASSLLSFIFQVTRNGSMRGNHSSARSARRDIATSSLSGSIRSTNAAKRQCLCVHTKIVHIKLNKMAT